MALHGQHPERPRRLSRRHLCPRHGLPRRLYHARRAALDRRAPGEAPWLADIHVFGIGSTLSFGPSGSSINAMNVAVPRLVAGLTRGLFPCDIDLRWQSLLDYEVKVVELDWSSIKTEYRMPPGWPKAPSGGTLPAYCFTNSMVVVR